MPRPPPIEHTAMAPSSDVLPSPAEQPATPCPAAEQLSPHGPAARHAAARELLQPAFAGAQRAAAAAGQQRALRAAAGARAASPAPCPHAPPPSPPARSRSSLQGGDCSSSIELLSQAEQLLLLSSSSSGEDVQEEAAAPDWQRPQHPEQLQFPNPGAWSAEPLPPEVLEFVSALGGDGTGAPGDAATSAAWGSPRTTPASSDRAAAAAPRQAAASPFPASLGGMPGVSRCKAQQSHPASRHSSLTAEEAEATAAATEEGSACGSFAWLGERLAETEVALEQASLQQMLLTTQLQAVEQQRDWLLAQNARLLRRLGSRHDRLVQRGGPKQP